MKHFFQRTVLPLEGLVSKALVLSRDTVLFLCGASVQG